MNALNLILLFLNIGAAAVNVILLCLLVQMVHQVDVGSKQIRDALIKKDAERMEDIQSNHLSLP